MVGEIGQGQRHLAVGEQREASAGASPRRAIPRARPPKADAAVVPEMRERPVGCSRAPVDQRAVAAQPVLVERRRRWRAPGRAGGRATPSGASSRCGTEPDGAASRNSGRNPRSLSGDGARQRCGRHHRRASRRRIGARSTAGISTGALRSARVVLGVGGDAPEDPPRRVGEAAPRMSETGARRLDVARLVESRARLEEEPRDLRLVERDLLRVGTRPVGARGIAEEAAVAGIGQVHHDRVERRAHDALDRRRRARRATASEGG